MKHPHGWKTRLSSITRDKRWLAITAVLLMAAGYALACAIVWQSEDGSENSLQHHLEVHLHDIATTDDDHARALALWLHLVTGDLPSLAEELEQDLQELDSYLATGELWGIPVKAAIQQHAGPQDQQGLFHDYIIVRLDGEGERGKAAWKRLEAAASRVPPAPLANEFLGHLLDDDDRPMEALHALQREATMPAAKHAREYALELAIDQSERTALREMLATPAYRDELSGWLEMEAGIVLGDVWMQFRGIVRSQWHSAELHVSLIALLAALLWYAVFVRCGVRESWRWVRPLPALLLGIVSVWPVLLLLHYQEDTLGFVEDGTFPNDLLYYVFGVGLREELAKLLLYALLLPWLLKKQSSASALMAGAFVGLGFALEENTSYYQSEGFGAAAVRLLTANFMHAGWTALAGHALYEMIRTRFARAEHFVATFAGVVVTHGLYDWVIVADQSLPMIGDISIISFFILALLAHQFFDLQGAWVQPSRSVISLLSIFVLGTALLIALSFIVEAIVMQDLLAVNAVGAGALSLAPIAVFYIRKFGSL